MISFPATRAIYFLVFRIPYMGFLDFVSLFVILGIGAGDIFVFVDAWRQSKMVSDPDVSGSIVGRLDWTYRRAAGATVCS